MNTESDPKNCGGCGITCAYTCAAGCVPLLLATVTADADAAANGFVPPGAVASNGSEVFVLTAASGGVVQACNVTGRNQTLVTIASGLDNTNNMGGSGLLALGGTWAYWPGQTAIEDVATTGSPTTAVFTQSANASIYSVATNTTQVFWSDASLGILSCAIGATCASPTPVASVSSLPAAPQILAADDLYVYWMDADADVYSASSAGGAPVMLAIGSDGGSNSFGALPAIVAAAGRVYYVDPNSGELMTASGGTPSSAALYSGTSPIALATDGATLYWSDGTTIAKCALGASCATPTTIYGGTAATSLAVDATNIYWIDEGSAVNGGPPAVWEYHK